MEIQPAPVPLSNLGPTSTSRPDNSGQGARAESERPVEKSDKTEPHRGQSIDIEV